MHWKFPATGSDQYCMGAAFSSSDGGAADHRRLDDLPESCVALILSRLEPPEICRLALVNRTFRLASSADCVWDHKLPSNYEILIRKLCQRDDPRILRKKDVYARLCCPNRLAGHDSMEVWLDKVGGGLCVGISWKGLKINGISDRRNWDVDISTDESRFGTISYLKQIWWLEVQGSLEMDFPAGSYSLYFRMQVGRTLTRRGRRVHVADGVRGWDKKPLQFHLSSSSGHRSTAQYHLNEPPSAADGRWINYHVGDFVVEHDDKVCSRTKLEFSMTQIDCTHTKGGICLDCVLVYPSNFPPAGHTCKCQDC